jgi:hypothetical protein
MGQAYADLDLCSQKYGRPSIDILRVRDARREQPFVRSYDKSDYSILFSHGDYCSPEPSGWNAIKLSCTYESVVASVEYTQQYSQIIVSKSFVLAPQV